MILNLTNGYPLPIYYPYKTIGMKEFNSFATMSFYMTLPSDASMKYFEDNKVSKYITRLPKTIELQNGEWEVSLCEMNFPHTWYNVNESNNFIGYIFQGSDTPFRVTIPPGFYPKVEDILQAISMGEVKDAVHFSFNQFTKRVGIKFKEGGGNIVSSIILYEGMAELLGFKPMKINAINNKKGKLVESPNVPDPNAGFRVLMVYTDIIEPQVVGDVFAPLLRIVNVTGSHGDMVHVQYDKPHYLPVSRNIIETLEINIRTHTGKLVPFERGRSYVKLHFRQRSLQ